MKNEKLRHIILTVLLVIAGASMIEWFIMDTAYLRVIFKISMIMFWLVFILNMVLRVKDNGETEENQEMNSNDTE